MHRRPANVPRRLGLQVGPAGVLPAEQFHRAVVQILGVVLKGRHAGDVDVADIYRRQTLDDPVGYDLPGPPAKKNAQRVETRSDEKVLQLGRFAHQGAHVGRKALGTTEELVDASLSCHRYALHGQFEMGRHALPVGRNLPKAKGLGYAPHAPRLGHRLKEAQHQPAHLVAIIGKQARVFDDGHVPPHPLYRLCDQVVVLGGVQGHVDAGHLAQFARPHASAVDHVFGLDLSLVGDHTGHPAPFLLDSGDPGLFQDARAAHPGPFRQCHCGVYRVDAAIFGRVEPGEDVVDMEQGPHLLDLCSRDLLCRDAMPATVVGAAAQAVQLLQVAGDLNIAHCLESAVLSGLLSQPFEQLAGVFRHADVGLCRKTTDNQPGRVPGGSRRQVRLLQ